MMVMKMGNIKDKNITIFGDSISKGVSITDGKIVKVENNAVNLLEEHYGISINNRSVFGQTLKRVYDKKLIDEYLNNLDENKQNVLVISLGGNDSDYNWDQVAAFPLNEHHSKTPIAEFTKILEEIIIKVKQKNVRLILTNLFPIDSNRYFDNIISKKNDRSNILQFLNNDISNLSRHQEVYNDTIIKLGNKYNVPVLDIRSIFLLNTHFLLNLSLDGIHPNADGQIEIAKVLIEQIDNLK